MVDAPDLLGALARFLAVDSTRSGAPARAAEATADLLARVGGRE